MCQEKQQNLAEYETFEEFMEMERHEEAPPHPPFQMADSMFAQYLVPAELGYDDIYFSNDELDVEVPESMGYLGDTEGFESHDDSNGVDNFARDEMAQREFLDFCTGIIEQKFNMLIMKEYEVEEDSEGQKVFSDFKNITINSHSDNEGYDHSNEEVTGQISAEDIMIDTLRRTVIDKIDFEDRKFIKIRNSLQDFIIAFRKQANATGEELKEVRRLEDNGDFEKAKIQKESIYEERGEIYDWAENMIRAFQRDFSEML